MVRTVNTKTLTAALALAGLLLLTGCASIARSAPGIGVGPIELEELARDEYVVLDSTTGSYETVHFLCFHNRMFSRREVGTVGFGFRATTVSFPWSLLVALGTPSDVGGAIFDAMTKMPEAEAVIPLTIETESSGLPPIFWTTKATVKGKAIKIKSDRELGL